MSELNPGASFPLGYVWSWSLAPKLATGKGSQLAHASPWTGPTEDEGGQTASQPWGQGWARASRDRVISCHLAPEQLFPHLINGPGAESLMKGDQEQWLCMSLHGAFH